MSWKDPLRALRDETARVIRERNAQLSEGLSDLEARGRKIYGDLSRAGYAVKASTPAELRNLALAAAQGRLPQVVGEAIVRKVMPAAVKPSPARSSPKPKPQSRAQPPAREYLKGAGQQAGAAFRGAVDEASFGLVDKASAGARALLDGGLDGYGDRYRTEMDRERAKDAYDAQNFGAARTVGEVAGFVGSLAATGGAGAATRGVLSAVRIAPRLARIMEAANAVERIRPLTDAGLTTLAAGGGATAGVGGQLISDIIAGRPSGFGDYAAAALGGAVGGLALRGAPGGGRLAAGVNRAFRNPMTAGAIEGATTAGLQAGFDGREISARDLAESARGGAIGARVGEVVGKYGVNGLSSRTKGAIGETISVLKSRASGDGHPLFGGPAPDFADRLPGAVHGPGLQRRVYLTKGYTIADHVTPSGVAVEAKFGPSADLSSAQRRAERELLDGTYRIDHWLPRDIGGVGAIGLGAPFGHLSDGVIDDGSSPTVYR